jgi:hypothetical protein
MAEFTEAEREAANKLLEGFKYVQAPMGRVVAEGFYKLEDGAVTVRGIERAELIGTTDLLPGENPLEAARHVLRNFTRTDRDWFSRKIYVPDVPY